jgi:hypothetical protein
MCLTPSFGPLKPFAIPRISSPAVLFFLDDGRIIALSAGFGLPFAATTSASPRIDCIPAAPAARLIRSAENHPPVHQCEAS